jgi:hypothetical protein
MNLIDQVENDRDAVVIDAEILQISDQVSSGEIDAGKSLARGLSVRDQPASFDPLVEHLLIQPCVMDNPVRCHDHTSMAWRGL